MSYHSHHKEEAVTENSFPSNHQERSWVNLFLKMNLHEIVVEFFEKYLLRYSFLLKLPVYNLKIQDARFSGVL